MPGTRASIIGVGPVSRQFTENLAKEIIAIGPKKHGIVALGVYDRDAGTKDRAKIQKLAGKLRAKDISVPRGGGNSESTDPKLGDLVELKQRVYKRKPDTMLLIVDASEIAQEDYAQIFRDLRTELVQSKMTVLCFTDDGPSEKNAYKILEGYTKGNQLTDGMPIVEAIAVARPNSPLSSVVGGYAAQNDMLAKSLAGMWSAPFNEQVHVLRQSGQAFIGLAMATDGLTMEKNSGLLDKLLFPILRHTTWRITAEQAQRTIVRMTDDLLHNLPAPMTTVKQFSVTPVQSSAASPTLAYQASAYPTPAAYPTSELPPTAQPATTSRDTVPPIPITVNILAPFRPTSKKFTVIREGVHRELRARGYQVERTNMAKGRGKDITKSNPTFANRKGKFYCQACVLFSIDQRQI